MGRIISGSTQRGIGVDTQLLSALPVPNPAAGVAEVWDGVVGGVPGAGDVVTLNLGSVDYSYSYTAGDTAAMMADGVCDAAMLGSFDEHFFTFGGTIDAGDEITLDIDLATYTYTAILGDTPALVAAGIAAAAAADTNYAVTVVGNGIQVKALLRGAGLTVDCFWSIDPGADATILPSHPVVGVVAQAAWTAAALGAAVTVTNSVVGPVTVAPTSSKFNYGAGTTTFAALTLDTPGIDAWAADSGVATGSMRTTDCTAVLTIAGGASATLHFVGYFGATLGWVSLGAPTAYLAGSYAVIVPYGAATRVLVEATAFAAGATLDCTIQG